MNLVIINYVIVCYFLLFEKVVVIVLKVSNVFDFVEVCIFYFSMNYFIELEVIFFFV